MLDRTMLHLKQRRVHEEESNVVRGCRRAALHLAPRCVTIPRQELLDRNDNELLTPPEKVKFNAWALGMERLDSAILQLGESVLLAHDF